MKFFIANNLYILWEMYIYNTKVRIWFIYIFYKKMSYRVVVASQDHCQRWMKEWFVQACHGKIRPMKKMSKWDIIFLYAPKKEFGKDEKLQAFVWMLKVTSDEIEQVEMFPWFTPYRKHTQTIATANIYLHDLKGKIAFFTDNKNIWLEMRKWFFQLPDEDGKLLQQMFE